MNTFHFNCNMNGYAGKLDDGTCYVMLSMLDKDTGNTELFPLHLEDAVWLLKKLFKEILKAKRL